MVNFILKNNIKLFVLLESGNSTELVTFLRSTNSLIVGLVPINSYYDSLDYSVFAERDDFVTHYLFISTVVSMYNLAFFNKKIHFFKTYNYYFIKLFYNNYKFL